MSGLGTKREVSLPKHLAALEARIAALEAKVKTLEAAGPVEVPSDDEFRRMREALRPYSLVERIFGRRGP